MKQEIIGWQWHHHMPEITTPAPHHPISYGPDTLPATQPTLITVSRH